MFMTTCFYLQLEEFLKQHESRLPLPPAEGEDTIFEYVVNSSGEWEHWTNRVSSKAREGRKLSWNRGAAWKGC